ncbi:GDSL-type esterase/lipase family protein [Leptolyngbya sp. CCNP1308]|uniref:GDSL-type esterase/lipase family protein n=1 Tax=Leptolyngbya sp. CCNP1308 TaxID=3110255 RepID=UPI002B1FA429|nr:GDSL-type esterase/lipase family protein [Leptolyngbya sp. CCNP1308]MEA5449871.1 GDSL-type esterase/lipase family protein [Leptolyngbya sp. CCNP1308]
MLRQSVVMDVWLLAAQLAFGSGARPSEVAETAASLPSSGWANTLLSSADPELCSPANLADGVVCFSGGGNMATAGPAQPPRSMGAAAVRWPRPEQVMTPSRRPTVPRADIGARPVTGAQLYQFRTAALRAGALYAQVAPYDYINQWQRAFVSPTHGDWQALLAAEATAMARRQGEAPLTVMVGDSLALWLPVDDLPADQLWLNQSISGETTAHMLGRLHYFAAARPQTIHLMAGINDLKVGVPEAQVIDNYYQMVARLRQQHPQARLVVYSILPTRLREVSSDRIQRVNQRLAALATHQGATYVDLHSIFSDSQGLLRADLTTDGLHLSSQGYTLWQAALASY